MAVSNISSGTVAENSSFSGCSACSLLDLVLIIQSQLQFSTIFIMKGDGFSPKLNDYLEVLNILERPSIQFTSSMHFMLKRAYRSDILAVVYIELDSSANILKSLAEILNRLAQTRIVFVCFGMTHILADFLRKCWAKKMINFVALIAGTDTYMSYTPFPEFQVSLHSVHDMREVFPNRMTNLYGYPFRGATDGIEPRDFFYTNRQGEQCFGGYTASLIKAFVKKINATLVLPYRAQTLLSYHTEHEHDIDTDVLDIFIGLTAHSLVTKGESYITEIIDWCVMLPVESPLPVYLYFTIIFKNISFILMFSMVVVFSVTMKVFLWLENRVRISPIGLFLNESCLRALFGQSPSGNINFTMKLRTILFLSYVLGLFFNTCYVATLDMLYTSAPSEPPIRTLNDLYHAPFKVLVSRFEYLELIKLNDEYEKYLRTFVITEDHDFYHIKRNEFNKSFAYLVPQNKWKTLEEQQSMFKGRVFRRTDICYLRFTPLMFLLHENSVFTEELNKLIFQAQQSGLNDWWVKSSFLELLEAGRIKLKPEESEKRRHEVTVYDLQAVFIMFAVFISICCLVFLGEIIFFSFKAN